MRRMIVIGSLILTLLGVAAFGPHPALTQPLQIPGADQRYVPRLGDIMGAMQLRHFKLWFAGKLHNWELASYELVQMKASFNDAAIFYPGIPVADMTMMAEPIGKITDAIARKDGAAFAIAFERMTTTCNACHQSIGRGFVEMQVPTASPFSNQSFAPATP